MKIRSTCPACGERFPRSWYFTMLISKAYPCPGCGAAIKVNTKWELVGSSVLVAPCFLLGIAVPFGLVSWSVVGIFAAVAVLLGWIAFPYVTPFDLVSRGQDGPQSGAPETRDATREE